jgi:metaxin
VPRPLQQLFDLVPLVTYDANALPARSQSATSGQLPTLYVFASEHDALHGLPSFNPGCLKWQVSPPTS